MCPGGTGAGSLEPAPFHLEAVADQPLVVLPTPVRQPDLRWDSLELTGGVVDLLHQNEFDRLRPLSRRKPDQVDPAGDTQPAGIEPRPGDDVLAGRLLALR